jgi:hypothetical protein
MGEREYEKFFGIGKLQIRLKFEPIRPPNFQEVDLFKQHFRNYFGSASDAKWAGYISMEPKEKLIPKFEPVWQYIHKNATQNDIGYWKAMQYSLPGYHIHTYVKYPNRNEKKIV